jgi:hypothetical protein
MREPPGSRQSAVGSTRWAVGLRGDVEIAYLDVLRFVPLYLDRRSPFSYCPFRLPTADCLFLPGDE